MAIVRLFLLPLAGCLAAGGAGSAGAAEHAIGMSGMAYVPANLEARLGDTVVFTNTDGSDHNVFVPTKGFGVDLGVQKSGVTTRLVLTRPGAFEVECVLHANMLLKVEVKP